MFRKFKTPLIVLLSSFVALWIVSFIFSYFTYSISPEIILNGLNKEGYYSGLVSCNVQSDNGYKIAKVSVLLDGKELKNYSSVSAKKFRLPFKVDTFGLSHGQHSLKINAVDSSYNQNKNSEEWSFYVDNVPLKSAFLQQEYKVDQGRTVHAKIQANKQLANVKIKFLEKEYNCYPETEYSNVYECFIPIDCEINPGEYLIGANLNDFVKNESDLMCKVIIQKVSFPRQKGFTVDQAKLEEEKEVSMSNKILEEALEKWLDDSPNKKLWSGSFEIPIDMKRISTPFGEIRTNARKGRYLHRAVDILNFPKSVVWASQDGKVIIKDRFLMSGNTVVLDHGVGVFTLYYHLEDFSDVEVGDIIKKGNPVGRLGMTGYANGYHLHWELRINNMAVDPFQWTKKGF